MTRSIIIWITAFVIVVILLVVISLKVVAAENLEKEKEKEKDTYFTSNVSLEGDDDILGPVYAYLFIQSLKNEMHLMTDYHDVTDFTYHPNKYNLCVDFEPMNISDVKCDLLLTSKKNTSLIPDCNTIFVPCFVLTFIRVVSNISPDMLIRRDDEDMRRDRMFCCFAYSNCNTEAFKGVRDRQDFYIKMQERTGNRVTNVGTCLNRNYAPSGNWKSNAEMLKNYKFVIAFENEQIEGYITEKLVYPMIARTIPIYLGAPDVLKYFNPRSFINVADFPTFEDCIEYVVKVDSDPVLYEAYLREPFLRENKVDKDLFSFYYGGLFYRQLAHLLPRKLGPYIRTCMLLPNHVRLVTFADGGVYQYDRILKEAERGGYFKSSQGFSLSDMDTSFQTRHGLFIDQNPRLYGYCIWKPYLILQQLSSLDEGDILVYTDFGANIVSSVEGNERVYELYCELLEDEQKCMTICEIPYEEKSWIKMDTLYDMSQYYDMRLESLKELVFVKHPHQRECCTMLFKKHDRTMSMLYDWYLLMSRYHNINDAPSVTPNDPSFIEHRHDQSVLSVISKIYAANCIVKKDLYPFRRKNSCLELKCKY